MDDTRRANNRINRGDSGNAVWVMLCFGHTLALGRWRDCVGNRYQEGSTVVSVTVGQMAEWVCGEVLGDPDLPIMDARSVHVAQPGDITFVDGERNVNLWQNCKASAAVVALSVPFNGRTLIRVSDPLMAFACIMQRLRGRPAEQTR